MTQESNGAFHDVGRIFPGDVRPLCVPQLTPVSEALKIMIEKRYSQLPVVDDQGTVRGVFSLWAIAQQIIAAPGMSLHDQAVEDIMVPLPSVAVTDSLDVILEHLNRHDAVLVESPRGLQAVATSTDVLIYFYRVARPYVLLQEIELSLRELIQFCLDESSLAECVQRTLKKKYGDRACPTNLRQMTFDDYRAIVTNKLNWKHFVGILGNSREMVSAKLEQVRILRNDVFHFRDSVTVVDHETLAAARNWLFDKALSTRDGGDKWPL